MVIFKIENSIFNCYIMLLLLKFFLIRVAHPRFTSEISYKCHLDSHQLLFFFLLTTSGDRAFDSKFSHGNDPILLLNHETLVSLITHKEHMQLHTIYYYYILSYHHLVVGFCGAQLCLIRLMTQLDSNNVAWFLMGDFLRLSSWSGDLGRLDCFVTHCESCAQDVKPFFGDQGFAIVVVLKRLKYYTATLYFSLIIVKSLQLHECRQITEPRKYCLVRVIVFFVVFSLFLSLTGWEFRVNSLHLCKTKAT